MVADRGRQGCGATGREIDMDADHHDHRVERAGVGMRQLDPLGEARRADPLDPDMRRDRVAEAEGRVVTTIEGLSRDRSHPVQQALVAEHAVQCGFCTPGIALAATALLTRNPDPSEDEIKSALPNLCRCGVYPRLVRAVQRAGRVARGAESISAAPAPGIDPSDAARAVPAMNPD